MLNCNCKLIIVNNIYVTIFYIPFIIEETVLETKLVESMKMQENYLIIYFFGSHFLK